MIKTMALAALLSAFVGSALAATDPSWTIKTIDRTANGNRGIATVLGNDGRLHVVFTGCSDGPCKRDELFYGIREADGKWTSGPIDSDRGKTGWSVSLLVDHDRNLNVFYNNHYKYPVLRRAVRPFDLRAEPSKAWKTETISKMSGGDWTSSAEGIDGIYVANTAYPTNDISKSVLELTTLKRDGTVTHEILDASWDAGFFSSTVIGNDGLPVIVYMSNGYPDGDLNVTRKGFDGKWTTEELDYHVVKNSVAVDAKGFLHIAYNKIDEKFMKGRDLWYATNAPDGRWHRELIEGGEYQQQDTGHFPKLKLDAQGGKHIIYDDNFHEKVMYARNLGDGWKLYSITRNKQDGYYAAFEFDAAGGIDLFYDAGFELRYAHCPDCAVH